MESKGIRMTPYARSLLLPRLVILAGIVAILAATLLSVGETTGAILRFGGGLVSMAGLVWFLVTLRRKSG
jgi:hypothetical protein